MKIIVVLLVGAMFVFPSCGSDTSVEQLRAVNRSLESSNAFIAKRTADVLNILRSDPAYAIAGRHYSPKVDSITRRSTELLKFIKSLKAGLGDLEKDKEIVREVFVNNKKGVELYNKLADYSARIRNQFSEEEFEEVYEHSLNDIALVNDFVTDDKERSEMWVNLNLEGAGVLSAKTLLNTLQNDVLIIENRLVDFYMSKSDRTRHFSGVFAPLVALSSSQVKVGEEIEITTGLAFFTTAVKPEVSINGTKVPIEESGVCIYNMKANKKAGEYVLPVIINFIDIDGSKKEVKREVKYRVVE